jgi:ABC-2 type transport system ATP-binding protein
VEGRGQTVEAAPIQQRLEQVAGVSRVVLKTTNDHRYTFAVESLQGRNVRSDVARSVVEAGWNLNELKPVAVSLEEIFLELTASEKARTNQ